MPRLHDETDTRSKKKEWSKNNYFGTDSLNAVKLLGRTLCASKMKINKWKRTEAAAWAVEELHRRLPDFRQVWEESNNKQLSDSWLAGRIDHPSSKKENKASQMKLEEFVSHIASDSSVYSWGEWEELVDGNANTVVQIWYFYLLPFSYNQNVKCYAIQKPGITTNPTARLKEHSSRGERGEYAGGKGLWPAKDFVLTCELGRMLRSEAEAIESECMALIGDRQPAKHGEEFYAVDIINAVASVKAVLNLKYNLVVKIKEDILSCCVKAAL